MNPPLKIVVATRNPGKLREIAALLDELPVELATLADYPACPEAEENATSYLENAREKARVAAEFCGTWVLADDSGLEVEALDGAPGVRSARYAGDGASGEENNAKLLQELAAKGRPESPAAFRCVMVLRNPEGREWLAEGRWAGRITPTPRGARGFGYDPVFFLEERGLTAAELPAEEKNRISHRGQALSQMKSILSSLL